MSQQEYLKAINKEIQKLNGVIDHKIMHHYNYKREARRHKELLNKLRRERRNRTILSAFGLNLFTRA